MLIYKILLPGEWNAFEAAGRFEGSAFDHESGFVHCSSRAQVGATARRVFGEATPLVVVAVDPDALGDTVRWEPSSDGGDYPHVYGPLPLDAVVGVHPVTDATHVDDVLPVG